MDKGRNNMVVINKKMLWITFMLVLVLGFSSNPTEARRLATFGDNFSNFPSRTNNFGTLPSGPSTDPPRYEIPPPSHVASLLKTDNFGMLPSGPS